MSNFSKQFQMKVNQDYCVILVNYLSNEYSISLICTLKCSPFAQVCFNVLRFASCKMYYLIKSPSAMYIQQIVFGQICSRLINPFFVFWGSQKSVSQNNKNYIISLRKNPCKKYTTNTQFYYTNFSTLIAQSWTGLN